MLTFIDFLASAFLVFVFAVCGMVACKKRSDLNPGEAGIGFVWAAAMIWLIARFWSL